MLDAVSYMSMSMRVSPSLHRAILFAAENVGEPLASPWARKPELTVSGLAAGPLSGTVSCVVRVTAWPTAHFNRALLLIDGRVRGESSDGDFEWDTTTVADGPHRLRIVVYHTGLVRTQAYKERIVTVHNTKQP